MKHLIFLLILFISITSCKKEEISTTKILKTEVISSYNYTLTDYNIPNGDTLKFINHPTKTFTIYNEYLIGFNYYIKCHNGAMTNTETTTINLYIDDILVKTKTIKNTYLTQGILTYQIQ